MQAKKVCIIGGGPGGLLALRHLYGQAEVDLYEAQDDIGGMWLYSPLTQSECEPSHPFLHHFGYLPNSTYKELKTNIPAQAMTFMDFPLISKTSFIPMDQFHSYIKKFATHHRLERFIHLKHIVLKVKFNSQLKKFKVKILSCKTCKTRQYDYVIVASGKFSKPYIPQIPGIFEGQVIHSHSIRSFSASLFDQKRVLLVGLSVSGLDALKYILKYYGSLRSLIIVCNSKFIES